MRIFSPARSFFRVFGSAVAPRFCRWRHGRPFFPVRIIHENKEAAVAEAGKLGVIKILLPVEDVGAEIGNPGIRGAPNLTGRLQHVVAARFVVNRLRQAVAIRAANLDGRGRQWREGQVRRRFADENDRFTGLKVGGRIRLVARATGKQNRGTARQRQGQGFVK